MSTTGSTISDSDRSRRVSRHSTCTTSRWVSNLVKEVHPCTKKLPALIVIATAFFAVAVRATAQSSPSTPSSITGPAGAQQQPSTDPFAWCVPVTTPVGPTSRPPQTLPPATPQTIPPTTNPTSSPGQPTPPGQTMGPTAAPGASSTTAPAPTAPPTLPGPTTPGLSSPGTSPTPGSPTGSASGRSTLGGAPPCPPGQQPNTAQPFR